MIGIHTAAMDFDGSLLELPGAEDSAAACPWPRPPLTDPFFPRIAASSTQSGSNARNPYTPATPQLFGKGTVLKVKARLLGMCASETDDGPILRKGELDRRDSEPVASRYPLIAIGDRGSVSVRNSTLGVIRPFAEFSSKCHSAGTVRD